MLPQDEWSTIRLQIAQAMVEHELVAQALRTVAVAAVGFVLVMGLLVFFLWRRCVYLNAALLAATSRYCSEQRSLVERHSTERSITQSKHATTVTELQKRHSLELSAGMLQVQNAFVQALNGSADRQAPS